MAAERVFIVDDWEGMTYAQFEDWGEHLQKHEVGDTEYPEISR